MGEYRVVIGGGSAAWRTGLAAAFAGSIIFDVVESVDSSEVLEAAVRSYPEVVLWKPDPQEDLVSLLRELKQRCPFTLPVLMVQDPRMFDLMELLRAGLRGCLPLRLLPRQIIQALELIAVAGILCIPRLGTEFFEGRESDPEVNALLKSLTKREYEVLTLLCKNLSNQEIAQALFLSESTVKSHLRSIFRKLGVRNRSEALAIALSLQKEFAC
ncbi:MAG: helix-turn-helix domain-containing protein [Thermacetogeniaceae bacterium]